MAIPKLTDIPGVTSAIFTRGEAFPFPYMPYKAYQDREDLPGGDVYVRDNGTKKRFFRIVVENETATVASDVNTLFEPGAVEWADGVFYYYPNKDTATKIICRLTEPAIVIEQQANAPGFYTIEINCREE